jgi:hypothetical protein
LEEAWVVPVLVVEGDGLKEAPAEFLALVAWVLVTLENMLAVDRVDNHLGILELGHCWLPKVWLTALVVGCFEPG